MKSKIKKRIIISLCFLLLVFGGIYLYTYVTLPESYYILKGENTIITNKYIPAKGEIVSSEGESSVQISLFGIPVKNVNVSVIDTREVVACGVPFGIKMYTNGIMVVSMSDVDCETGSINPAYEAGVRVKDIITKVNSKKIYSVEQLSEIVEKCSGEALSLTILRDNKEIIYEVTPVKSKTANKYRLGLWVRDSSAGIGTMTYYDKETGMFAGLGHG
ncbi:MAG: PDZ domain-containing protein, partial [Clostridia bacterium]|nr:PDZ domain-containing protein [Clostridia bacterium]